MPRCTNIKSSIPWRMGYLARAGRTIAACRAEIQLRPTRDKSVYTPPLGGHTMGPRGYRCLAGRVVSRRHNKCACRYSIHERYCTLRRHGMVYGSMIFSVIADKLMREYNVCTCGRCLCQLEQEMRKSMKPHQHTHNPIKNNDN